jgi:Putative addiction module component
MALTREQIKTAALELDPVEREALAEEILLSIADAERSAIDAAWLAEARQRDAGKSSDRPVDEVIDRLRNKARQ